MKKVILVGGGHAHLYALHTLLKEKIDLNVVLISASRYQYYSGMFSGYTEGIYEEEDIRIDLKDLTTRANVSFVQDEVVNFNTKKKKVYCSSGKSLSYDVISFDIGSNTEMNHSFYSNIIPIKPNYLFPEHIDELKKSSNPIVVGGGAAGVELALTMLAWREKHITHQGITLISSSSLLQSFGTSTSNKITQIAKRKGLQIFEEEKVQGVTSTYVQTDKEKKLKHTGVLWLTGAKSFDLFKDANISTDGSGFLKVNTCLQNDAYPFVFGAGDCISINKNSELPKNGVYAIRQAPILWRNIKKYLNGEELDVFKPQKKYIAILSTGKKEALFIYGRFSFHSRIAWFLKHYIDCKFIKKFK